MHHRNALEWASTLKCNKDKRSLSEGLKKFIFFSIVDKETRLIRRQDTFGAAFRPFIVQDVSKQPQVTSSWE